MVSIIRMAFAVLALALLPQGSPAQHLPLSARASVDSTLYRVGDRIRVHIELQHPAGAMFRPVVADTVNGFHVLERQPVLPQTDTTATTEIVIAKYEAGQAVLPPLTFAVSAPGDTGRSVSTNPLILTVQTVAVDTTKEFRDLKPPLSVPLTLAEILTSAGVIIVILAAVFLGYRYWKKRKEKKAAGADAYVPPSRPAHVIALEQLAVLKEKKLWQQGHVKAFYSEITEIFRRYLENRYSMMAMEETTDEIMAGMRKLRFSGELMTEAETILRRADLVKFAKYQPTVTEHEEMFTVVYDIVDKTKIVHMTPVSITEAKAVVHAGS